jgi:glycosyltransferase involved in cell wall biosynthesis
MNLPLEHRRTSALARASHSLAARPLPLPMQPIGGVEPLPDNPGSWLAVGDRPQFELGLLDRFASQWVRLTAKVEPEGPWSSCPILYFDFGRGYSEGDAMLLPRPAPGRGLIDFIFLVPLGLTRTRFDLLRQAGRFRLGVPAVQRLSKPRAALAMACELASKRGWRSVLGDAAHTLLPVPTAARVRAYAYQLVLSYQRTKRREGNTYAAWICTFEPSASTYATLAAQHAQWAYRPLVSIVMPVFNTPEGLLHETIESVQAQIYPHWELCIADNRSTEPHVRRLLQQFAQHDARIKVVYREKNGDIAAASNTALELATGDFVALLDHNDLLHPLALHFVAEAIVHDPEGGLIYTDEDKLDERGQRFDPYFKCELNYELLLSQNMICHLGVYRRTLLSEIGGFRKGFQGSQDYDLALRTVEKLRPEQVVHIPRVLYHRRAIAGSTAVTVHEKPSAVEVARKAVAEHLARRGVSAECMPVPDAPAMTRVRFAVPSPAPLVSIIIPTRDRADLLAQCIDSLLAHTRYGNYEVIIVDNGSVEPATFSLLARLPKDRIRILRDDSPFNFSALNNRAVREAKGSLVCLMNNDIEITCGEWLGEMVSFAIRPEIGAVGARLWYPDGRLQHGGIIIGIGGVADHAHRFLEKGQPGYCGRAVVHQSFSAVTAACLAIRKEIYEEVNGLDERFSEAFNDVDFCLRVREAGYRNVWTPFAQLVHHESASRGYPTTPEKWQHFRREMEFMRARWQQALLHDPAYSPNLTLNSESFDLAWPARIN